MKKRKNRNEVGFEEMRVGFIRTQAKYLNGETLTKEETKSALDLAFNSRFHAVDALAAEENRVNNIDGLDDVRYGESFKNVMAGLNINHRCALAAMKNLGWFTGDKDKKSWTIAGCKVAYGSGKTNIHVEENPALFRFEDGKCYVDTLSHRYPAFIVEVLAETKEMFGDTRYNDILRKKKTVLGVKNQIFIVENAKKLGYTLFAKSGNKIENRGDINYDRG